VEQVQRTCAVLRKTDSGFRDVETVEIVRKSQNVKRVNLPIADLGLGNNEVLAAVLSNTSGTRMLPCAYEEGDDLPIGDVTVRAAQDASSSSSAAINRDAKRQKPESDALKSKAEIETAAEPSAKGERRKGYTPPAATKYAFSFRSCVAPKEIYGHTGYLTFATYCPEVLLPLVESVEP